MWLAIFFVSANGKRIVYLIKATSVEISGNEPGAFVGNGSALSKCPIPGTKKSSGETDVPVLMPLQPVLDIARAVRNAKNMKFQFNFTVASIN